MSSVERISGEGTNPVASVATGYLKRVTEREMIWTIVVVLLILWALGLVASVTLGGLIHVLLVVAVVVLVLRLVQGRSPV